MRAECPAPGCSGIPLSPGELCFEHVDDERIAPFLETCRHERVLDLSGIWLSPERCVAVREHWPPRDDGWRVVLDGARIAGGVSFSGLHFADGSSFDGARFTGRADLRRATFGQRCSFRDTEFSGRAELAGATIGDRCFFTSVTFGGGVWAKGLKVGANVDFVNVDFGDDTYLRLARFDGRARFEGCRFGRQLYLGQSSFEDGAYFAECEFGSAANFGVVRVVGDLSFESSRFAGLDIEVRGESTSFFRTSFSDFSSLRIRGRSVTFDRTRFEGGADVRVSDAEVSLVNCSFASPTLLARRDPVPRSDPSFSGITVDTNPPDVRAPTSDPTPSLTRLRGTDLTNLSVADVDLGQCRFDGAHNLDLLKVQDTRSFANVKEPFRARRKMLFEEQALRGDQPSVTARLRARLGGDPDRYRGHRMRAQSVAQSYRSLRRGLEDRKDEPGAAAFYYGEMEMRRQAFSILTIEHLLLTLYWAVSGYGLRAWRAVACLAVVLAAATVLFATIGFGPTTTVVYRSTATAPGAPVVVTPGTEVGPRPGFADAAVYSLTSTTALLRPTSSPPLTRAGQVVEVGLRLTGPVLIALAALAVRGRLKR